jgi:hypothetical protein
MDNKPLSGVHQLLLAMWCVFAYSILETGKDLVEWIVLFWLPLAVLLDSASKGKPQP